MSRIRLLEVSDFSFHAFPGSEAPSYAVASHRWHKDDEATLKDVQMGTNTQTFGFQKVKSFARYVRDHLPRTRWLWIDTCCINQDSEAERARAVNSMFRWYKNAQVCLAYLADVPTTRDMVLFSQSEWFKRGWTLQELVAPGLVIFLSSDWHVIGHKGSGGHDDFHVGPPLELTISQTTRISVPVLKDYSKSVGLSVEERMKWRQGRQTTEEEDISYCMLGIFDISMPVIYGEGNARAEKRLLKKIHKGYVANEARTEILEGTTGSSSKDPSSSQACSFECFQCEKSFGSQGALDQHRQNSPAHAPTFECLRCKKSFGSQGALDQHRQNSPAHAPTFECHPCEKSFDSQGALDQHRQNSPAHAPTFECLRCKKSFGSQGALDQHRQNSPAHAPTFECLRCKKSFGSQGALDQHLHSSATHAPASECHSCRRSFKGEVTLDRRPNISLALPHI